MFVRSGDALLNVVSFGDGPRTFVAHGGWTGNWEMWQQPFETMSRTWRCVSFDHRGTGATRPGHEEITRERLVGDVLAVLDACDIEQCVLAGESAGGRIVLDAVLATPDRFVGLVLVDSVPEVTRQDVSTLVDGSRSDYARTVEWFVEACVPEENVEHLKRWGRQMLMRSDGETAARLLECLIGPAPDLAAIAVPTLVIHGELDTTAPLQGARVLAERIPGAQLRTIPGAGHVPTVTAPDVVAAEIERWASSLRW
ncbi:MAG TPA: alpha/beta hydrolase [Acidimicrobiia bacterium]